jgi:hypothetical protein
MTGADVYAALTLDAEVTALVGDASVDEAASIRDASANINSVGEASFEDLSTDINVLTDNATPEAAETSEAVHDKPVSDRIPLTLSLVKVLTS